MSKVKLGVLAAVLAALFVAMAAGGSASADTTKTIHVGDTNNTSLRDRQLACTSIGGVITQWHFVINGIDVASHKPLTITVFYSNGTNAIVPLGTPNNNAAVAHYTTTFNGGTGATVTDATATIYSAWSGQFVLSDVTCVIPKANVKLTKTFQTGPFTSPDQACFTLTGTPSYTGPSTNPQCLTANGVVQWNGLVAGSYTITETTPPTGYVAMPPINFTVAFDCTGVTPPCYLAKVTPSTYEVGPISNLLSPGFLQVLKLLGPPPGTTWTGPAATFYVCKNSPAGDATPVSCTAATPPTATLVFPSGGTSAVLSGPLDEAYYTVCESVPTGYAVSPSACQVVQVVAGEAATANQLTFVNTPVVHTWCSPGFWLNNAVHFGASQWPVPTTTLYIGSADAYGPSPDSGNPTLLEVLQSPGTYFTPSHQGAAFNAVGTYLSIQAGLNPDLANLVDNCPLNQNP